MKHDKYLENINRILEPIQRQMDIYNQIVNTPVMNAMEPFLNEINEIQANIHNSFIPWFEVSDAVRQQIENIYININDYYGPEFSVSEELSDEIYSLIDEYDIPIPEDVITKENKQNKQKLTRDQLITIIGIIASLLMFGKEQVDSYYSSKQDAKQHQEIIEILKEIEDNVHHDKTFEKNEVTNKGSVDEK